MVNYNELKHFKFWCQKILPLVYDDSLSYYEVLCKIVDYINKLIDDDNSIITQIEELKKELEIVQKWIENFDTSFVQDLVTEYITKCIKTVNFGLSSEGYFMASIPESWSDIKFGTIQNGELYGHLTLRYD